MSLKSLSISLSAILFFGVSAAAQQPAQRDLQGVALLQQALTAMTGAAAVSDLTLSGTVNLSAGSDDESGTAVLLGTAIGQSRLNLSLPSGQRTEVRDLSLMPPAGAWVGTDGVSHSIAAHNLWTDPTWFFPAFLVGRVLSNPSYAVSYVGQETLAAVAVQHVSVSLALGGDPQTTPVIQGLSQTDIYLGASSSLPVAVQFNAHPDDDLGVNIPIRFEFSNYQSAGGVQVPYHIQKFIQNGLVLDLECDSAAFNTGIPASTFAIE